MSKLFCCLCLKKNDDDAKEVVVIDLSGTELTDVPSYIFLYERTLEKILLSSNRIKDLPLPLFHCESLTTLVVDNNYIEILPPALGTLVNLQILDVSRNCISFVSENIKSCKKLTKLNLSLNPIGQFPEGITQLICLEDLYMSSTMIDFIPANIGRLVKLRVFELRDNVISTLPKAFARLTSLISLDIGQNDFTELPEAVGELRALEYLYIEGNEIEELPPFIRGLENLSLLDGISTDIRMISKNVGDLTKLVHLYLSNAKLKAIPVTIGRLKNLVFLRLDGNQLQALPQTIGHLQNLEQLYLAVNRLDHIPISIGLLRKLKFLDLGCNCIKELPSEIGSCVNLRILILQDNLLKNVPAEIGNLVRLKVCNLISNRLKHLPMSVLKLRNLKALWLSPNQVQPLTTLVKDFNPETKTSVLTCYLLPQRDSFSDDLLTSFAQENRKDSKQNCGEQPQSRPRISFSIDSILDRQSHFSRIPTPYPRRSRSFPASAGSSQLNLEDDEEEIPVINLSNNWNRGDEVRVAVVKKQIPSSVGNKISASSIDETPFLVSPTVTLQPPPYHIAAMNSKHAPFFESTNREGLPDNEAISIIEDLFRKSLPISETSDSPQSEHSGSSGTFSNYVNQKLFVNQNILENKVTYHNIFSLPSNRDQSKASAKTCTTNAVQSTDNLDLKSENRLLCKNIEKVSSAEEISESNSEYLPEGEIYTSGQVYGNTNTEEYNFDEEIQGRIQCTAEVHQFPQAEENRNDHTLPESIMSSASTENDRDNIASQAPSSSTLEEKSDEDSMIYATCSSSSVLKGYNGDDAMPAASSLSSVLKGNDGDGLASASSTMKENYPDFVKVRGRFRLGSGSVLEIPKRSIDFNRGERTRPDVGNEISTVLDPKAKNMSNGHLQGDGTHQFSLNSTQGQLSTELPKSVESRSSQTPSVTPMNFFPEKVSSLRDEFEKKPRPWVFGKHKNPTVKEVVIMKTNFQLGFYLEGHKSGFYVKDVNPGSPASEVLERGDKILQIDGLHLNSDMDLEELVAILEDFTRPFSMMISRT